MSRWSAQGRLGPYTLAALIWRADGRCTWCGAAVSPRFYAIDHVTPRALGGGDEPRNLVLACAGCNAARGAERRVTPALRARIEAAGRTPAQAWGSVRRQTAIPVGRGTRANRKARRLAREWFGAAIEKDLGFSRAWKARGGPRQDVEAPF